MWFSDKTPKPASLPTNLYRITMREMMTNIYTRAKATVEIEAHRYGESVREHLHDPVWFLFLRDGEVVYRIVESAVESIELVEPDLFVFEFLFDEEAAVDRLKRFTPFEPGRVGDLLGYPYIKLHTNAPTADIKVTSA